MRTGGNRRVHLFGLNMSFFAARCERRAQCMSPLMALLGSAGTLSVCRLSGEDRKTFARSELYWS